MAVEKQFVITGTGVTGLGNAREGAVSTWVLHFVSASFVGSVTLREKVTDSGVALGSGLPVAYTDRGAGTVATAAITGDKLVEVNASACDLAVDCTAYTSGSLTVYARPVIG